MRVIERTIEFMAVAVVGLGMMAVDGAPLAPIIGFAVAWVLWQIKEAIFGQTKVEEYPDEEM